jgi:four helix bundle protein
MAREAARTFEDLIVWKKAHEFVLAANIAKGFKKKGRLDKARFLNMGQGSAEECGYYLILARDLGYGNTEGLSLQLEEVSKLLHGYMPATVSSDS